MVNVTARAKVKGKHYEIMVNLDEALKFKAGKGDIVSALDCNAVYSDLKKGTLAPQKDLIDAFGTADLHKVAEQIIKKGEVQKTQEFREEERETKIKQVISLILRNATDQNGRPYTEERIKRAAEEVHFAFDNKPAEQQVPLLLEKLKTVIPIKIETKKIKLKIPARFTGQIYSIVNTYKESEEWLSNGDLEVIVNVPSGMQLDFYDKLNNVTHGAVVSEELKEKK